MFTIGRTIAADQAFALPESIITDTTAILAKKRTGKSNTAAVLVEQVFRSGHQVIIIDPKGDWWGLRSMPDGSPGLTIPILGGIRGDVQIAPTGGAHVAQLLFDTGLSAVIDVSRFESKGQQARFLAEFADTLFRLHQTSPRAVLLVLEEAIEFLPQMVTREDGMTRCVGAWTKLIRLGGSLGLGVCLIAQRAADLNKQALTQIETLIVHRTPAARDRKAIEGWLDNADESIDLSSIAGLANGEAWIVSTAPDHPLSARVQVDMRSTFDSGQTPKPGAARVQVDMATVDLQALTASMSAALEQQAQDDPKILRARIAELEKQLANQKPEPEVIRDEVPVVPAAVADGLMEATDLFAELRASIADDLAKLLEERTDPLGRALRAAAEAAAAVTPWEIEPEHVTSWSDVTGPTDFDIEPEPPRSKQTRSTAAADGSLDTCQRALLTVLAQHPDGMVKNKLGFLAGYNPTKSTIRTALGALRRHGYITPGGVEVIQIQPAGLEALGSYERLPTGQALLDYWLGELNACEQALLRAFVHAYPRDVPKDEIEAVTGYDPAKSTFRTAMGVLRRLDLVPRGQLRAADEFMQAIRG